MAPIGTLSCETKLDENIFRDPNDLVSGQLLLTYHTSEPSADKKELFGPLVVTITLRCHLKLIVRENRTSHAFILFHEEYDATGESLRLFDGPYRALEGEPQQLPFAIKFPTNLELPPTFHTRYRVHAPKQAGKHQAQGWVDYSLLTKVGMPGIDVQIANPQSVIEIQYKQGNQSSRTGIATQEFERRLEVESYQFLPEDERPSTLLDKMKATAKRMPKPRFVVTATCFNVPTVVSVGRGIRFQLRVRAESDAPSAATVSDIAFIDGKLEIVAITATYATNQKGLDSPILEHEETAAKLVVKEPQSGSPFSKANDLTQDVSTEPVPADLLASFDMKKLKRLYRVEMVLRLQVAGEVAVVKKAIDLRLLPEQPAPETEAGAARVATVPDEHEELPAYDVAANDAAPNLHQTE